MPFPTANLKEKIISQKKTSQNRYTSQSSANPKRQKGNRISRHHSFEDFEREILGYFASENFKEIDKIADQARLERERLAGGYWKIRIIYAPISEIYTDDFVTEEMWLAHLEKLKRWKENFPDSVTARIALARSYRVYGWFARGSGFSNTVTDEDFEKFNERLKLAAQELEEAQKLPVKCPEMYAEMLLLATTSSRGEKEFDDLLEEAIAFEPDYYYYYYAKTRNSLPRWNGKAGDAERFAARLDTVKSDDKNILYYLYVSNMANYHFDDWTNREILSWGKAKQGFKELEQKYGIDNHRLNEYAFLASTSPDTEEAQNAFNRLGNNWDSEVFSEKRFYEIKDEVNKRYVAQFGNRVSKLDK